MSSKVQICNLALTRLKGATITSLTDNTVTAKLCNILYDDIADEVMMEGPWTSTIARASLARTTDTPIYDFKYEYQLPTSPFFLRILNIDEEVQGGSAFRIESDKFLTDLTAVKIRYVGRVTDTQSYDIALKAAIVSRLTTELSYSLAGSMDVSERMFQRYRFDVENGLALNGKQGSNEFIISPDLTEVRIDG